MLKTFVKLGNVPSYIPARVSHAAAGAGARVGKNVNSPETKNTHFLLLALFLVDQAFLQHRNL